MFEGFEHLSFDSPSLTSKKNMLSYGYTINQERNMSRMKRAPTLRDVAKLADVSSATVSYVLSGRQKGESRISDETRERILKAVKELNYVPNHTARSLRRSRTDRICFLVQRLGVPSNDHLIRELQEAAEQHGFSVIVAVGDTPKREQEVLEQMRRGLADALVTPNFLHYEMLQPLIEHGIPVAVMNNYVKGPGIDTVKINEFEASYQAVRYLIDKGHREIAFIGHSRLKLHPYDRYEGYLQALKDAGIAHDSRLTIFDAWTRKDAYNSTSSLLQLRPAPSAIFAGADRVAINAILAIRDAGLKVPDDIAVIGSGNIEEGEVFRPHLTTIGPPKLSFKPLIDLLFTRLQSPNPAESREAEIRWELIIRESS
jgi:DNA-binding LacI/PurR family transcriptional regulator